MCKKHYLPVTSVALLLTVSSVQSQATPFTNQTAFLAALPGAAGVLNFDSLSGGTILSGTTQTVTGGSGIGIQFPASVPNVLPPPATFDLMVVANTGGDNPTTSNPNSLGVNDPGNYNTIQRGTVFSLGLTSTVSAFGLSFISPDALVNDDIELVAGSNMASLAIVDRMSIVDGYYAYFLGIIDSTGFNSVKIQYGNTSPPGVAFLYNIDDLTVAAASTGIPTPGTLALLLGGVPALLLRRDRRVCAGRHLTLIP